MRQRLEAAIDWLQRRGRRATATALDAALDLDRPGYGLSAPSRMAVADALRSRGAELAALSFDELTSLDWAGADGHHFMELDAGLVACIEANDFPDDDNTLAVWLTAYLVEPTFGQRLGDGPWFVTRRDGTHEPDDGAWEAEWRSTV